MLNQLKEISLFLKSMDNGAGAALIQQGYVQDVVHFPEADMTAAKNAHIHYLREGFEYPYEFKPHITLARGNQVDSLKRQGVVGTL